MKPRNKILENIAVSDSPQKGGLSEIKEEL